MQFSIKEDVMFSEQEGELCTHLDLQDGRLQVQFKIENVTSQFFFTNCLLINIFITCCFGENT